MTDYEIERSYLEAKDRKGQIQILAELNDCEIEDIQRVLVLRGIDFTENKKKSLKKTNKAEDIIPRNAEKIREDETETLDSINNELPSEVREALENSLETLEEEISALERKYSAIAQYLINPFGISQI